MYLGTTSSPEEYYRKYSEKYHNPQSDAVTELLSELAPLLQTKVLDLGCGAGLATTILTQLGIEDCIGIDRSPPMIERYQKETDRIGLVANFWDVLPPAKSAMAVHSLHLCPPSRTHQLKWRLKDAGIETLLVISPLKRAIEGLGMECFRQLSAKSGPDNKTVWAWAFLV